MALFDRLSLLAPVRARGGALVRNLLRSELNQARADIETHLAQARADLVTHIDSRLASTVQKTVGYLDGHHRSLQGSQLAAKPELTRVRNEIVAQLAFQLNDLTQLVEDSFDRASEALGRSISTLAEQLTETRQGIEKVSVESTNRLSHLDTSLHTRLNTIEAASTQLMGAVANVQAQVAENRLWLEKVSTETSNLIAHLDSSLQSRINLLEQVGYETRNFIAHLETGLQSRLNTLENERVPALLEQIHENSAIQLAYHAASTDGSNWKQHPAERYEVAVPEPFEGYLARAERDFPNVFTGWRDRLVRMADAFEVTKVGNAAHPSDLYSRMFRDFVRLHASGRVLDIGCGVFGRPFYLEQVPAALMSGIEPLALKQPVDFEIVHGISEYLPWPDHSFSTVISATSLDHCVSLERSLSEMARVVRPGGTILLWIGLNPGSPKYDPEAATPNEAADEFHLFHFDVWFDSMLEERFTLEERMEFRKGGYSHVFYKLAPIAPATADT